MNARNLGLGLVVMLVALATFTRFKRPESTSAIGVVSVAAASDLVACLDQLDAAFRAAHPDIQPQRTVGSSGTFSAQIANGAPFDVFLSADVAYPKALIAGGHAQAASLTPYARGRIVLWSTTAGCDVTKGLTMLTDPAVRKIAIANPAHAPYGRAAQAALMAVGIWEVVQPKLVFGDNIAQAAHFVQTGNAQVGIVALSLVMGKIAPEQKSWWEIPENLYPPLDQAAVLTARGVENPAARLYLDFLSTPPARAVFNHFGFRLPDER